MHLSAVIPEWSRFPALTLSLLRPWDRHSTFYILPRRIKASEAFIIPRDSLSKRATDNMARKAEGAYFGTSAVGPYHSNFVGAMQCMHALHTNTLCAHVGPRGPARSCIF